MENMETEEKHESFVMVSFHRVTTNGVRRLFGSRLDRHPTTVILRVKRATRKHDLNQDWYYGGERLIEVELSEAQFASLLTTMNVGDGVPGTLRSFAGQRVEPCPDDPTEPERVEAGMKAEFKQLRAQVKPLEAEALKLLEKKALTVADRQRLAGIIGSLTRWSWDHLPHAVDQFAATAEKMVVEAKAEVEAFTTEALQRLGLKRLRERLAGGGFDPELPPADLTQERVEP